ncbi:MAG: type II toxin-antitoxin system RelE/ParE family toxin [Chloroflexota bacterium]
MGNYTVTFTRSARKELEALPASVVRKIFPRIEALSREPRPRGSRKLQGEENVWRIRVGDYRVIFTIDDADHIVDVVAVRHRREAYRLK